MKAHRTLTMILLVFCSLSHFQSSAQSVTVGADRLFGEYAHLIDGKKLALVSNHSSRLLDGTHLADALHRYPEAELKVLFGMEYNIRTNDYSLARDQEAGIDRETGLVKYSLYGETHKPTPEMLGDVGVIVFDIQEVGARFYEHINILGFVMEAAAEADKEVVVLDRPNPITGLRVDGFMADEEFLYRFGSYAPLPVLHGMTMGELARMYKGEQMLRGGGTPRLHVVEMLGWKRSMWYDETGLAWRKPSPNLLTLNSIIAYAGTCLFEGLNISEGRGTNRPFEYIGAPWIDHLAAADLLNGLGLSGVVFEPVTFTPEQKPHLGRPPELNGELCRGIFVNVTDRERFEPLRAGIAMVWAFHHLHADRMVWNDSVMERLMATKRFKKMITEGKPLAEIFSSWAEDLDRFKRRRAPYLIYR